MKLGVPVITETNGKSLMFCLFHSGLSNERTSENKDVIVDEFYCRMEAELVKSPEDYKMELVAAVISLKK